MESHPDKNTKDVRKIAKIDGKNMCIKRQLLTCFLHPCMSTFKLSNNVMSPEACMH